MSKKTAVKAYQVMGALGHKTRFGIMEILANVPEMNVNTIQKELNKKFSKKHSQPMISQHLGKLKEAGLVKSVRDSRIVNYHAVQSDVVLNMIVGSHTLTQAAA